MKPLNLILLFLFVSFAAKAQSTSEVKYRRSSLFTLIVDDASYPHAAVIKDAFLKYPIPDKFNDHNLTSRTISGKAVAKDQLVTINNYMDKNEVAKNLIAKWFNRNQKGTFNMNLVAERGSYNASEMDANIAKMTKRGVAMLADAGEELIGNTFVLVSDFKYTPDSEVVQKVVKTNNTIKDIGGRMGGFGGFGNIGAVTGMIDAGANVAKMGNGYVVKTTSYLFRLNWNDSVTAVFYNDYWNDSISPNGKRKAAFDSSRIFTLDFIGKEDAWATVQTIVYAHTGEDVLIAKATVNALDAVIAKLQKNHAEFRTKTQLLSTDPCSAKIGKKEGLDAGDSYEVLEQREDENGKTSYVVKGV